MTSHVGLTPHVGLNSHVGRLLHGPVMRFVCASLLPLERALLPFVYEADDENCKKDHHRDEAEEADLGEYDRPGKEERDFEVEQDEQDRDEVIADVELHPRV